MYYKNKITVNIQKQKEQKYLSENYNPIHPEATIY